MGIPRVRTLYIIPALWSRAQSLHEALRAPIARHGCNDAARLRRGAAAERHGHCDCSTDKWSTWPLWTAERQQHGQPSRFNLPCLLQKFPHDVSNLRPACALIGVLPVFAEIGRLNIQEIGRVRDSQDANLNYRETLQPVQRSWQHEASRRLWVPRCERCKTRGQALSRC